VFAQHYCTADVKLYRASRSFDEAGSIDIDWVWLAGLGSICAVNDRSLTNCGWRVTGVTTITTHTEPVAARILARRSSPSFFVSSTVWTVYIISEDCHSRVPIWHRVVTAHSLYHSLQPSDPAFKRTFTTLCYSSWATSPTGDWNFQQM